MHLAPVTPACSESLLASAYGWGERPSGASPKNPISMTMSHFERLLCPSLLGPFLSAVVLEELHAGVSRRDRKVAERLERDFNRARRILVPTLSDWTQAGKVLALLASEYGYEQIGQERLTNDALIAMSAGRYSPELRVH
jgi:predicted nucleic acid-binding protein